MGKKQNFYLKILIAVYILAILVGIISISTRKRAPFPVGITLPHKVAVVDLSGLIEDQTGDWLTPTPSWWIGKISQWREDPRVKAMVLRINSPGGTIGAVQELYRAILKFKSKGKPVVASFGDTAASGAYYVACAADKIFSLPGTITGSIGVIIASPDLSELFKKVGIGYTVIKSGKEKDALAFYRKLSPEERAHLQSVVDDAFRQFLEAVSRGRKIPVKKLLPLANGRIYTGSQALKLGLVDALGDYEDALREACRLGKVVGKPEIVPTRQEMLRELLFARSVKKPRAGWLVGYIWEGGL